MQSLKFGLKEKLSQIFAAWYIDAHIGSLISLSVIRDTLDHSATKMDQTLGCCTLAWPDPF